MDMVHRVGRRAGWGLADQAFSSLTNFGLAIFVARSVGLRDFGIFTLVFTTYTIAVTGMRAGVAQPLSVRFAGRSPTRWAAGTGQATGTALALGVAVGIFCVAIAPFLPGTASGAALAFGITMGPLLLQDSWRFAFFTDRKGHLAFLNDLIWALIMFPAFVLLATVGWDSVSTYVFVWGGSAGIAALVACLQTRIAPRPLETLQWWRSQRDLIPGFMGDFAIMSGINRATTYLVAAIAGIAASASLRGAGVLLGPVNLVFQGIPPVALPESVRLARRSRRQLMFAMVALSATLAAVAIVVGFLLLSLPQSVGEALLHDTWEPARRVVFVVSLALGASAINTGAMIGIRALGHANRMFTTRVITAPIIAIGVVVGAALFGVIGAAGGNAIATLVTDVLWWQQFVKVLRLQPVISKSDSYEGAVKQGLTETIESE